MNPAALSAVFVVLTLAAAQGPGAESQRQLAGEVAVAYGSCSIVGLNLTMPDGDGGSDRQLLRFLRVPYAEPPVGARRFAAPESFDFNRTDCLLNATSEEAAGSAEDLLHVSIRTPDLEGRLPVLVLLLDASSDFDGRLGHNVGDAFAADVVLATVGSRFGVLGNLPAGQNNGLLDQRLALRFLRDALGRFGGDPERVTLAGHGPAAAAAVSLHSVGAVGAAGFSRAVLMSGSIASPLGWSVSVEAAAALDRDFAKSLDCDPDDECQRLLDCLRNQSLEALLKAESALLQNDSRGAGRFAPSFNASSSLPDALWRQRAFNGSLMIGAGGGAGLAQAERALRLQDNSSDWGAIGQTAFEAILDREFGQFPRLHSADGGASVTGRRYLRLTLSDWPRAAFGAHLRPILARALSDFNVVCPVWVAASDLIGQGGGGGGGVFVYLHDVAVDPAAEGAAATDAGYLLGEPLVRPGYPTEHKNLSRIMMKHLSEFVTGGAPGADWSPSSAIGFDFMRFSAGEEGASFGANLTRGGFAFGPGRCPVWSAEMPLADRLADSASPSPPPAPPPLPPLPPLRVPPAAAQPFSNLVLRNYTINAIGVGILVGQTIRTPANRNMTEFLGLPYAEPPTGDRRFEVPKAAEKLTEKYLALKPKPACPQSGPLASAPLSGTSEDCLYLNLWTPVHSDRDVSDLPVLVFLHGGFFQAGDASDERWRGSHVLDQVDAVVVTVAYRLGALGFLWQPSASVRANLGLRDQALALRWVRNHVIRFGGSRHKISLVGVEAGAASVGFHLLDEQRPFQRAVLLSGSPNQAYPVSPKPDSVLELHGNFTARYLNCSQSAQDDLLICLRALNASDIVNAAADFQRDAAHLPAPFVAFGPVLDENGDFLKADPWLVDALPPVPLLLGGVDAPGNLLARLLLNDTLNITRDELLEHLRESLRHFPRYAEALSHVGLEAAASRFATFPSSAAGVGDVLEARLLAQALGDRHFTCPTWKFMAKAAALSPAQVFGFLLAEPAEDRQIGDPLTGASLFDDAHFAMGSPAGPSKPLGEARAQLSAFLVRSLAEFAETGSLSWEPYTAASQRVLLLRDWGIGGNVTWPPRYVEDTLRGLDCAFWDQTLPCVDSPDCISQLPTPAPTTPTPTPTTPETKTESTGTRVTEESITSDFTADSTASTDQTASTDPTAATMSSSTLTPSTHPSEAPPTSTLSPKPDGLEPYAVALIVVFSIVGVALLVGSGFLLYKFCFRDNSGGQDFAMQSHGAYSHGAEPRRMQAGQPPGGQPQTGQPPGVPTSIKSQVQPVHNEGGVNNEGFSHNK